MSAAALDPVSWERMERLNGDPFAGWQRDSVNLIAIGLEAIAASEAMGSVQAARKPDTKHIGIERR